jgi:Cu2+-containing amine oxidase
MSKLGQCSGCGKKKQLLHSGVVDKTLRVKKHRLQKAANINRQKGGGGNDHHHQSPCNEPNSAPCDYNEVPNEWATIPGTTYDNVDLSVKYEGSPLASLDEDEMRECVALSIAHWNTIKASVPNFVLQEVPNLDSTFKTDDYDLIPGMFAPARWEEPDMLETMKWLKDPNSVNKPPRLVNIEYYEYSSGCYLTTRLQKVNPTRSKGVVKQFRVLGTYYVYASRTPDAQANNLFARPGYSCIDDGKSVKTFDLKAPSNQYPTGYTNDLTLRKRLQARFKASNLEYKDEYVYYDVSLDGRLEPINGVEDTCDCTGAFAVLNDTANITNANRPRALYFTPFYNDKISSTLSAYSNPIAGLFFILDAKTNEILTLVDKVDEYLQQNKALPYNVTSADYDEACKNFVANPANIVPTGGVLWDSRPKTISYKDMVLNQPGPGSDIKIEGNKVTWGGHSFRWAYKQDKGPVLYDIRFLDPTVWVEDKQSAPKERSMFYDMRWDICSLYNSNSELSRARAYFDTDDYPSRDFISPLVPGVDVPKNAIMRDVETLGPDGVPTEVKNAVAIYVMPAGPLYRHLDYPCFDDSLFRGSYNTKICFTFCMIISNYDFLITHSIDQVGVHNTEFRATGVMEHDFFDSAVSPDEELLGGSVVGPYREATTHQHAFVSTFTPVIDSEDAKVVVKAVDIEDLNKDCTSEDRCSTLFEEKNTILDVEVPDSDENAEVIKNLYTHDFSKLRTWVFESGGDSPSKNYLNHTRGYQLQPVPGGISIYPKNARAYQRSVYGRGRNLYLKRYKRGEENNNGLYFTESNVEAGLGITIQQERCLKDKPVVCTYISGFEHVPHTEQWPYMYCEIKSYSLIPHNLTNENMSMYIKSTQLL